MDLGGGTLARIDCRILCDLDSDERWRMVRGPVAGAVWSTWKSYCDAAEMERRLVGDLDALEQRLTDRERVLTAAGQRMGAEERLFRAERAPLAFTSRSVATSVVRAGPG